MTKPQIVKSRSENKNKPFNPQIKVMAQNPSLLASSGPVQNVTMYDSKFSIK